MWLGYVRNKDGTEELVNILTLTSDSKYYVFSYPYIPGDTGREVNPVFIRELGFFETSYVKLGLKIVKKFPDWVTL